MKPVTAKDWVRSKHNSVVAELNVSGQEIAALGGKMERPDSEHGQVEMAVFALNSGEVISLSKGEGNPVPDQRGRPLSADR
jgi:hypothetical protein